MKNKGEVARTTIHRIPVLGCDKYNPSLNPLFQIECNIDTAGNNSTVKLIIKRLSHEYLGDWMCTDSFDFGDTWFSLKLPSKCSCLSVCVCVSGV